MPKDRKPGKAGHAAGTKLDKRLRAARAAVEKRQRQLAGAMADLAALEAHQASAGAVLERVTATTDELEAGTTSDARTEAAVTDDAAPDATAGAEPEAAPTDDPEAAPPGESEAAPGDAATTDSPDGDAKGSDQWIGELAPDPADASDSGVGSESTEAPDGAGSAAPNEAPDGAEAPKSSDSTLIG